MDGGTNIWFKFSEGMENDIGLNNPIPDLVTGDFDSAEPRCLKYYQTHGAKIIHTPDQDETDFNKCVRHVYAELTSREMKVHHHIIQKDFLQQDAVKTILLLIGECYYCSL